jgi:hypothetical protein
MGQFRIPPLGTPEDVARAQAKLAASQAEPWQNRFHGGINDVARGLLGPQGYQAVNQLGNFFTAMSPVDDYQSSSDGFDKMLAKGATNWERIKGLGQGVLGAGLFAAPAVLPSFTPALARGADRVEETAANVQAGLLDTAKARMDGRIGAFDVWRGSPLGKGKALDDAGLAEYLERVNPGGKRIEDADRPNLAMGDMYGMLPKGAVKVSNSGGTTFYKSGDDYYATAYNPDVGEMDVVGYALNRGKDTELHVVQEMQGKGIGGELQFLYRKNNPDALSGGLTEAGEASLKKTFYRMNPPKKTADADPVAAAKTAFYNSPNDPALRKVWMDARKARDTPTLNPAQQAAQDMLDMLKQGRGSEVTEQMAAAADPQYLAKNYDLPIDEASRMARAQEMGFGDDLYVSSLKDIEKFDASGKFYGNTGATGVSATNNPEAATRYLDRYAEVGFVDGVPNQRFSKNVIPLKVNVGNATRRAEPYPLPYGKQMGYPIGKDFVSPHKSEGYDTAIFDDAISRAGAVKHSDAKNAIRSHEYVMSDPANIRSRFARFDPRLKHLANLSAGIGGVGLLPYLMQEQGPQ